MPPFDGSNAAAFFGSVFDLSSHSSDHQSAAASSYLKLSPSRLVSSKPKVVADPRMEKALRNVQGALTAIADVLQHEGVTAASIQELRSGIQGGDYITVLERAKKYAFLQNNNNNSNNNTNHSVMMACLLHAAWDSCMRFYQLQYHAAYRRFHRLRRHGAKENNTRVVSAEAINRALEAQCQKAEQVCTCQKELILAQAQEKRLVLASQQQQQQQQQQQATTMPTAATTTKTPAPTVA